MRIAENSDEFVDAVERAHAACAVEVISGEEEAGSPTSRVTAELGVGDGTLVLFDTGGGSSQFTFGHGGRSTSGSASTSGRRGSRSGSGSTGAVRPRRRRGARRDRRRAHRLDGRPAPAALVGIGGAVTNLAAVKQELAEYDADAVRGTVLDARRHRQPDRALPDARRR